MGILKKVQKQYQSLLASITQATIHIMPQFVDAPQKMTREL